MKTANRSEWAKTVLRLVALVLCCCMLSGCTMGFFDVEKLMRPPQPTGNKEALHRLLLADTNDRLDFIYPRSGEHRSAVISVDLGSGIQSGAIAFCGAPSGGTMLYFTLMEGGEWRIVTKIENPSSQVDRVCMGDLDGDGVTEIVVSWGSVQSLSSILSVYDYSNGTISEYTLTRPYGEFAITDLDQDGRDELFIAEVYNQMDTAERDNVPTEPSALALLYTLSGGELQIRMTAALDPSVIRYNQLAVGALSPVYGGRVVLLDGLRADNTAVTQMVYMNGDRNTLVAPLTGSENFTARPSSFSVAANITARDVDGDGVYELPMVRAMPLPEDMQPQTVSYITCWQKMVPGEKEIQSVRNTVVNAVDGYTLDMPVEWMADNVTCRYDASTGVFTVYRVERTETNVVLGAALLRIRCYSRMEWENLAETENYTAVYMQNNMIIAASLPSPGNADTVSLVRIAELLQPIAD